MEHLFSRLTVNVPDVQLAGVLSESCHTPRRPGLRVPSELDLMARLAGMTLRERWSDWHREPFSSASRNHISVWEKAA